MIRLALIDLNIFELNWYPYMVCLDKYNRSCNAADDLFMKICIPSKAKDINVKVFNVIITNSEVKTLVKHISCYCKCKADSGTCNSNQKWNDDKFQCKCKKYCVCKKAYSWNPRTSISKQSMYLKIIVKSI